MADEYSISAKLTMDTSGYDSGVKKAQSASKKLSKSITDVVKGFGKSGLSGAITSAGLALGGIGLAVGTAVKAIKGMSKALSECAEAYKVQLNAERALDTAINNSPFVTGSASKALKDYASQMQKVSNLGDEEIIPQMTQLIATGRTEAEVMKIIATASDMSASGAMSFDQAVTQLNATLNGNIGRLGQQNAELKGLTEEELKNGKAVDILGEKYKGLAKTTVDTKKQLQNAIGDLKETFGSVFENAIAPMRKFFTELIQGWADARKAKQEYEQSTKDVAQGTGDIEDFQNVIAGKQKELEDLKADLNALLTDDWGFPVEEAIRIKNEEIAQAERELEILKAQLDNKIEQQEIEKKQAEEENKRIETEKTVADLKGEYLEKIAEQERKWKNIKAVTGEQVKNEEKIKFYQDSLVDLMTKANGQITTNNQLYKDQMAIIQSLVVEEEKGASALAEWEDKLLSQQLERLKVMKDLELENGNGSKYEIETRYAKLMLEIQLEQLQREKELALAKIEGTENAEESRLKIIQYYAEQERLLRVGSYVKADREIKKETQKTWKEIASTITNTMKGVADKIGNILKQIFSKVKGAGKKLFEFNTDDALVNLLKFEDKVLTFFVETIPKLPAFFESALQSVSVLLQNLLTGGNINTIGNIINAFMKSIARYAPQIVQSLGKIIGTILDQIDFGEIVDWLLNGLISILPDVMKAITKVIKKLVAMLPKILPTLIKAIVSIVVELVKALPSILTSVLPDLLRAVLEMVKALLQHLPEIIKVLIEAIPQIIRAVIHGLIDFISNLSAKDLADIIVGIIKMTADIGLTIIKNIGKLVAELIPAMIQLIWELIKAIPQILGGILEGAWEGLQWVGEKVWEGVQSAGKAIASGAEAVWDGIKSAIGKLKFWASGTDNAPKGLAVVGEAGPELVRFNGGEQVLNTRNTQKALANMGSNSGNQFNVTFNNTIDTTAYALMQQLKQYNRQMAINSVM